MISWNLDVPWLPMVITIDGPAGAGKSTAARKLAQRLGFRFLDTGAMYRAVAFAAQQRGIDWTRTDELARLVNEIVIDLDEHCVRLNGVDVTHAIRTREVTSVIHHVADHPAIRARLVELQRRLVATGSYVTEGRDQGTVAFPDAECKIFLTASPEERARRRMREMRERGEELDFPTVLALQNARDQRDANRPVGRLVAAQDAVLVDTDGLTLDEVVQKLLAVVQDRVPDLRPIT